MFSAFFVLAIFSHIISTVAVHDSLNLVVSPKSRECFYADFLKDSPSHTVEIFVQSGGNLDITLQIYGPLTVGEIRSEAFENPIIEELIDSTRQADSETETFTLNFDPSKPGTYGFCLDNRHAQFVPKVVQVDVFRTHVPDAETKPPKATEGQDEETASVARVAESIHQISKGLSKIQLQQRRDRFRLELHSETNEKSHNHVVMSSIIETAVFIGASLFQIYFVRRWFSGRGTGPKM